MRASAVIGLATAVLLAAGCGSDGDATADAGGTESDAKTVTVELAAQNDSGESGTATLTGEGPKTRVVLELKSPASDSPQPAHIHKGTCVELDPAPAYPLTNVVDGGSETTVEVPIDELEGGRFAINVHQSEAEAQIYVSCGNIGGDAAEEDEGGSGPGYGY